MKIGDDDDDDAAQVVLMSLAFLLTQPSTGPCRANLEQNVVVNVTHHQTASEASEAGVLLQFARMPGETF
jgi:hypothetical protein